ncbi:MAG: siphovirus Gp157 family protein, partial [Fusobacteriaceae bacterium]
YDESPNILKQEEVNMKTYEIVNGMIDTLDIFLDSEQTGEDRESYNYIMEFLKEELETKKSNIVKYIRNIELEIQMIKTEESRLEVLRKNKEKKVSSLKEYMVNIFRTLNKSKIETEIGSLGLRKSQSVAIDDQKIIPRKYIEKRTVISIDKRAIGADLKLGKKIKGVHLEENYSLQIR